MCSNSTGRRLKNWTVMVYLAGDNNLESFGQDDLMEMKSVGSTDAISIVAQFDRMSDGVTRRYYLTHDRSLSADAVAELPEVNTGDPAALLDFILWGLAEYPAGQNTQPHRKWEPGGAGPEPVEPGVEYKPQPLDFHFVLLAQDEDGIVPWSWIEALKNYIRRFRVSVGFSLDHAAMETPFTQSRHVTLIGSVDAPVAVSQEVEDILRAAGCEIDRAPGTSAKEIKEEMDRRADTGLRFG